MKKIILASITCSMIAVSGGQVIAPLTAKANVYSTNTSGYITSSFNLTQLTDTTSKIYNDEVIIISEERGVISMSAKVLRQVLLKHKTKIITFLQILPYGDKLSSIFNQYFNPLISFLDKVVGGAHEMVYKFFKSVGFSDFWADLLADGIMLVIGWIV
ncbi:MAG: hypothetical protein ACRC1D_06990 [Culicoidibacterales bacterium]